MIKPNKVFFIVILPLSLLLLMPDTVYSQSNDSIPSDTIIRSEQEKPKRKLFGFLRNKKDSTSADSLISEQDEAEKKSLFARIFNKDKKNKQKAPEKPSKREWREMSDEDKEKYFEACREHDSTLLVQGLYSKQEQEIYERAERIYNDLQAGRQPKDTLSRNEGDRLKTMQIKDNRLRTKLNENEYKRRRKMFKYENGKFEMDSSMSRDEKMKILKQKSEYEAKKEALRKQRVIKRFNRKERRLRKRFALTDEEKKALAKGKNMRLRGAELAAFKRGKRKQIKYTKKLIKLRKKRAHKIQNKKTRKKMRKERRDLRKREREYKKERSNRGIKKRERKTKKRIKRNRKRT